jgi:hypothetical protein
MAESNGTQCPAQDALEKLSVDLEHIRELTEALIEAPDNPARVFALAECIGLISARAETTTENAAQRLLDARHG